MVRVAVVTNGSGIIRQVTATGHAGSVAKGSNIVCSAVTILLRTTVRLFEKTDGVVMSRKAQERGSLEFSISGIHGGIDQYVRALGDFLIGGLQDLQDEFPAECTVTICKEHEE